MKGLFFIVIATLLTSITIKCQEKKDILYVWGKSELLLGNSDFSNAHPLFIDEGVIDFCLSTSTSSAYGIVITGNDGYVQSWGENDENGGIFDEVLNSFIPIIWYNVTNDRAMNVICGVYSFIFRTMSNKLYGLGKNNCGTLGIGNKVDVFIPEEIPFNLSLYNLDYTNTIGVGDNDNKLYHSGKGFCKWSTSKTFVEVTETYIDEEEDFSKIIFFHFLGYNLMIGFENKIYACGGKSSNKIFLDPLDSYKFDLSLQNIFNFTQIPLQRQESGLFGLEFKIIMLSCGGFYDCIMLTKLNNEEKNVVFTWGSQSSKRGRIDYGGLDYLYPGRILQGEIPDDENLIFVSSSYCANYVITDKYKLFGFGNNGNYDLFSGNDLDKFFVTVLPIRLLNNQSGFFKMPAMDNYFGIQQFPHSCFGEETYFDIRHVCNNNGICEYPGDLCLCDEGYEGERCEFAICFGITDPKEVCLGRGICYSPNKCNCSKRYYGVVCEQIFPIETSVIVGILVPTILIPLFICSIVVIIIFVIFCIRYYNQKVKLENFGRLDNLNLILEEEKAASKFDISLIDYKKENGGDLFCIKMEEIKLLKEIGAGCSAHVYKCEWKDKIVCFKSFVRGTFAGTSSDDVKSVFEEFIREVKLLSSLNFPYVIQFLGSVVDSHRIGIITEYCEKGDMKQFLQNYKKTKKKMYPFEEKMRMIEEIATGMTFLNSKHVIHRDLKLRNVLIDEKETCKITDFGLSRIIKSLEQSKTVGIGTEIFMSPEITLGKRYDEKSDVFSFAIMLYIILTEKYNPYADLIENTNFIQYNVSNNPYFRPPLNEISCDHEWIKFLLKVLWNCNPQKRLNFKQIVEFLTKKSKENKSVKIIYLKEEKENVIDAEDFLLSKPSFKELNNLIDQKWPAKKVMKRIIYKKLFPTSPPQPQTQNNSNRNTKNDQKIFIKNDFHVQSLNNDDLIDVIFQ